MSVILFYCIFRRVKSHGLQAIFVGESASGSSRMKRNQLMTGNMFDVDVCPKKPLQL